jgi:hypothetical protein
MYFLSPPCTYITLLDSGSDQLTQVIYIYSYRVVSWDSLFNQFDTYIPSLSGTLLIVGLSYQLQLINSVFINQSVSTESAYQQEVIMYMS